MNPQVSRLLAASQLVLCFTAPPALASGYDWDNGRGTGDWNLRNGSLQVVVVPEPAAALLGGLGLLAMLRRRR